MRAIDEEITTRGITARSNVWQFSLATVFWILTGAAIALSLSCWKPGTGVLWAITCTSSIWAILAARKGYRKLAFSLASIAAGPVVAWLLTLPISPVSHFLFNEVLDAPNTASARLLHGLVTSVVIVCAAWILRHKIRKTDLVKVVLYGTLMSFIAAALYVPLLASGMLIYLVGTEFSRLSVPSFSDLVVASIYLLLFLFYTIAGSPAFACLSFHVIGLPLTLLAWLLRRLDPIERELSGDDWHLIEVLENSRTEHQDSEPSEISLVFSDSRTQAHIRRLEDLGVVGNDGKGYYYRGLSRFRRRRISGH